MDSTLCWSVTSGTQLTKKKNLVLQLLSKQTSTILQSSQNHIYEAQEAPNSGFGEQLGAITKSEFNNKMW